MGFEMLRPSVTATPHASMPAAQHVARAGQHRIDSGQDGQRSFLRASLKRALFTVREQYRRDEGEQDHRQQCGEGEDQEVSSQLVQSRAWPSGRLRRH